LAEGVGIDSRVSEASQRNPKLQFALGTIESELPKQLNDSFDVVLFISVLEHLWNPEVWLGHCHRVLRQSGVLFVHVPTWYAKPVLEMSAFKFGTSPACEMDDHKMYYSKRDLWPMLVKAGFKPSCIRMRYTGAWMTLLSTAIK
jgi:SAM-dependent methyltransferase